jgi:hypothetical protein
MSGSRRNRKLTGAERRKAFTRDDTPGQPSLWQRADCCGATIAANPDRMGSRWADVHEPGCPAPWEALGLDGEPAEVYPGAPGMPEGTRLRAVNRMPGAVPASPEHAAPYRGSAR